MPHWRSFHDQSEWLFAFDLGGRAHVVEIAKVTQGILIGEKGRKSRKPAIHFVGKKKPLALNKTNSKTIDRLYGSDTAKWVGKRITIYPTTTVDSQGVEVECIRIEPRVPGGAADTSPDRDEPAAPPADGAAS